MKGTTMFKSITLAAVVIAASASPASADASNISNFVEQQDSNGLVELGTVTAEGNGIVEINLPQRCPGKSLGSEQEGRRGTLMSVPVLQQNLMRLQFDRQRSSRRHPRAGFQLSLTKLFSFPCCGSPIGGPFAF
jgi:hypothetical protein